jgi:hypothetical protein
MPEIFMLTIGATVRECSVGYFCFKKICKVVDFD